jgi:hypothetical protein
MKFKGTLALGILAVALLAAVLLLKEPARPEDEAAETRYLFKMDEAKIRRIALTFDGAVVSAARGDRKWTLEKPVATPGNKEEWNGMSLALATLDYDRVVDEQGKNPASYGLDKPYLVVTFEDEKAKVYKVEFGLENPAGSSYYARRGNDPKIYLVSRYTRDKFSADLGRLREGNALRFDLYTVKVAGVQRPSGTLQLAKKGYNWFVEAPVAARADDTEVENLLRKLSEQPIADHLDAVDPAKVKAAFGPVRYRVSMTLEGGEGQILEIGAESPFALGAPAVLACNAGRGDCFTLPAAVLAILDVPLDRIRDRSLAEFFPFEVKGITFLSGTGKTVIYKEKDDVWHWRQPSATPVLNRQKVEDYLNALKELKASGFIDSPSPPADYGLEPPAAKIILDVENKTGTTILVGKEADGQVFVRNQEFKSVMRVPAAGWRKLKFDPAAWLEKK